LGLAASPLPPPAARVRARWRRGLNQLIGTGKGFGCASVVTPVFDDEILAFDESKLAQLGHHYWIAFSRIRQIESAGKYTDAPHALRLLRPRHQRPRSRYATCNKLAPPHIRPNVQ